MIYADIQSENIFRKSGSVTTDISVNSIIVPNILPTIKKGEIPTGIILKPKTKKSIVINNNLQFRKVVV